MRKFTLALALFLIAIVVACGSDGIRIQDSYDVVTPTLKPTVTSAPVVAPAGADATGLTFYREWEAGNYDAMYSLLTPRLQGLLSREQFVSRYQEVMETARINEVTTQAISASQNGFSAELVARVILKTAVVGDIVREHTMPLAYEGNRWGVDWDESLIMPELAGGHSLELNIRVPSRANLYDKNDEILAYQGTGVSVGVVPNQIQDEVGMLNALAILFDSSPQDIQARYADAPVFWDVPLGVVSSDDIRANFTTLEPFFEKGISTREGQGRIYSSEGIAPHLIGYLDDIANLSEEQQTQYARRGYRADERIGVVGLEYAAEEYLAGTRGGTLKLISPDGQDAGVIQEVEPKPGRVAHTTFDAKFQQGVQDALAEAITTRPEGEAGAVVVLDVNTGAVRAMASYPTYDASVFSEIRPDRGEAITNVINDPRQPAFNRATQGQYPPGSTFKIVTISGGIQYNLYAPDTRYYCAGFWDKLGPNAIKLDWKREGHGSIMLYQALTQSCNTYSYEVGYALNGTNEGDDPYRLPNIAREFGLGSYTNIEGIFEGAGLIPDPEWKLNTYGDGWSAGDAVNMAIGQGFVLATPLQIANMTASVANGGTLYQPFLIERIEESGSAPEQIIQPTVLKEVGVSAELLASIRQGLDDTTSGEWGTAVDKMRGLSVTTAGKTGTAQVAGDETLPHAWFTGYAPADNPEIAVAVIVENGGEGSAVSAPIFRRVVELYYGLEPTRFYWIPEESE